MLKLSCVQTAVALGDVRANLERVIAIAEEEAEQGAALVAFPELMLTGYVMASRDEARQAAEVVPGPATEAIAAACRRSRCTVAVGLLEREGDRLYNAVALVGPGGVIGTYRKTHLPHMGVDRFLDRGESLDGPFEVGGVRVGLLVCYDGTFPEPSRVLALRGADLILLPTNWPEGECAKGAFMPSCRALENVVWFAAVNRIQAERGIGFHGMSCIAAPDGRVVAQAAGDEARLRALIDPAEARRKRRDTVPGELWVDRFQDRRPPLYGEIAS